MKRLIIFLAVFTFLPLSSFGKTFRGVFVSFEKNGKVIIDTPSGKREFTVSTQVSRELLKELIRGTVVEVETKGNKLFKLKIEGLPR
ncbi:hypothetical protein [Thermovibrio sp.]